jgi:hypothetical protein
MANAPNADDLVRVTALLFRNPDISAAEFYEFWTQTHTADMEPLHKRYGVVEYRQVSPAHFAKNCILLA